MQEERESAVLACALAAGAPTGGLGGQAGGLGGSTGGLGGPTGGAFAEQLRASLAPRRATPAWCEHCARFTHTLQRGRVLRYVFFSLFPAYSVEEI